MRRSRRSARAARAPRLLRARRSWRTARTHWRARPLWCAPAAAHTPGAHEYEYESRHEKYSHSHSHADRVRESSIARGVARDSRAVWRRIERPELARVQLPEHLLNLPLVNATPARHTHSYEQNTSVGRTGCSTSERRATRVGWLRCRVQHKAWACRCVRNALTSATSSASTSSEPMAASTSAQSRN